MICQRSQPRQLLDWWDKRVRILCLLHLVRRSPSSWGWSQGSSTHTTSLHLSMASSNIWRRISTSITYKLMREFVATNSQSTQLSFNLKNSIHYSLQQEEFNLRSLHKTSSISVSPGPLMLSLLSIPTSRNSAANSKIQMAKLANLSYLSILHLFTCLAMLENLSSSFKTTLRPLISIIQETRKRLLSFSTLKSSLKSSLMWSLSTLKSVRGSSQLNLWYPQVMKRGNQSKITLIHMFISIEKLFSSIKLARIWTSWLRNS